MFKYYNHLGFNNPYYIIQDGKFKIFNSLTDIPDNKNCTREIDPVSVIELLNRNYILADRTIIKNINKTPWLAKPNPELNDWIFHKIKKHDKVDIPEEKIASTLFEKICNEIRVYIGEKKEIGVLLSGGMDSRIVAGAIDYLVKTKKLNNIKVTGLTWGNKNARDVVYAKEIAKRLNWKWKHYIVTANDLLNNITETAISGCEFSPIHLHALPQIRDDNDFDIIIAGSYGDSIGRAEYSGKHVSEIKSLLDDISNVSKLVSPEIFNNSVGYIKSDIEKYHLQFPEKEPYMQYELDYQLHYMRKMLNPCMKILTPKMEFCQAFTHPDVYEYIFSINPKRRNNLIYKHMLNMFTTKLDDIPWARTGYKYCHENGKPDIYFKRHHSYPHIIQKEIYNEIKSLVLSDEIKQINVFDKSSLKTLLFLIKHLPQDNNYYTEKIIWIASLAKMVKIYNVKGLNNQTINNHYLRKTADSILISAEYSLKYAKSLIKSKL